MKKTFSLSTEEENWNRNSFSSFTKATFSTKKKIRKFFKIEETLNYYIFYLFLKTTYWRLLALLLKCHCFFQSEKTKAVGFREVFTSFSWFQTLPPKPEGFSQSFNVKVSLILFNFSWLSTKWSPILHKYSKLIFVLSLFCHNDRFILFIFQKWQIIAAQLNLSDEKLKLYQESKEAWFFSKYTLFFRNVSINGSVWLSPLVQQLEWNT